MQKAFILIGVPGSGKSTWARNMKKLNKEIEVFSTDEYREKYLGNINEQSKNGFIFHKIYEDILNALNNNKDIIFDATNVSIKDRKQFLQLTSYCKNKSTKIAVVFNVPIEECILRDFNRERTVGKQVIEKFKNKYSTPSIEEGFDIILNGNLDLNDYKK